MKKIIGIVGENASGKTTVTNYLKEKYNAASFRFSDMLSDILDRIHVEKNRQNLQDLSTFLRSTYGEDIMSKTLAKDVELCKNNIIVTEGIRRESDITHLRKMDGFILVALDTNMKTRYNRLAGRNEKKDDVTKTLEEFQKDATHESEQQISAIAAKADEHINNNGSVQELHAQLDALVEKYK